jgi:hypothetical protein
MATIHDIGGATDPLGAPSLPEWAAAVRDTLVDGQAVVTAIAAATAVTTGTLVPAAGWQDYGSSYGGLHVTRQGPQVICTGLLQRNAALAVTNGGAYLMGTIPTGFQPSSSIIALGTLSMTGSNTSLVSCRLTLDVGGGLAFVGPATGTMPIGGWVGYTISYRGA